MINQIKENNIGTNASRNRCIARICLLSACSLGAYGGWIAKGMIRTVCGEPVDDEMRKYARRCWNWAMISGVLLLGIVGIFGGLIIFIIAMMSGLVAQKHGGIVLIAFWIFCVILWVFVYLRYSYVAYRRALAGMDFEYPLTFMNIL